MKNIFIISLLIVIFSSCEKELEIKTQEEENKIVINSIVNPDSLFFAEITQTFSPYANINIKDLTDAQVSVYENGNFVDYLTYHKVPGDIIGKFIGNFKPEIGKTYKIAVNSPELGNAYSETVIPGKVNLGNAKAVEIIWGEDNLTSTRFNFSFELSDPDTANYYFMTIEFPVYKIDTITLDTAFVDYQYCEIETGDLSLAQLYLRNGWIFQDKSFNGTVHQISGTATTYRHPFSDLTNNIPSEIREKMYFVDFSAMYIRLYHLSYNLYQYYSSDAERLMSKNDLYSEPLSVFSNVENGYGIFGGENISLLKVKTIRIN